MSTRLGHGRAAPPHPHGEAQLDRERSPDRRDSIGPSCTRPATNRGAEAGRRGGCHGLSVAKGCHKGVDRLWAGNLSFVPRTIWKGALSFGLVNIPVGLYPATSDKSIHFNQFEEGTSDRIRYKKVNERTGEEVPPGTHRPGIRPRGRGVRHPHRRGARVGGAQAVPPDRDLRLRGSGRHRSGLLPRQLLPGPRGRRRPRRPTRCCARP